jgi:serine protease
VQVSAFRATGRKREPCTRDDFAGHGIIGVHMRVVATSVVAGLALFISAAAAFGQAQPPTDQIIVKWRNGASSSAAAVSSRTQKLGTSAGMRLQRKQQIADETDVLQLDRALDQSDMNALLERMAADPNVEYAVADGHRWAHAVPNDPLFADQWYFQSNEIAATRANQAWDVTVGSNLTVVAVVDTGVRFEHPDLLRVSQAGKLLDGFDFILNTPFANDGDGRDADASDPGDFVTAAELAQPPFNIPACAPSPGSDHVNSSWHGTRVSSLIAALTNNSEGVAGTGWNTLILPVRVLGKCGGTDSDIITGMRWAAGISIPGVPVNPMPAQIINLSLGGSGACSAAYQQAVNEITARGVLIVVSVGNDGQAVAAPANCSGVLGVTGIRHAGTKVGFSNLGTEAGIGAPGGNCVNPGPPFSTANPCLFSITAAMNAGTTTPGTSAYTDRTANINIGTSFSAPLVAGAAALIHSLNAQLTPAQYILLLKDSATAFPTSSATTTTVCHVPVGDTQAEECICTTQTCGAGMLNTHAAVLAAQRPFAVANAPSSITVGVATGIDGGNSFASNGRTIASYQWTAIAVSGATPTFGNASQPLTTVQVSDASTFTLRLTVTDNQGVEDTADVAMATPPAPAPPTTPPAAQPSRGGGGGGNLGWLMLLLLSAISISRRGRSGTG